MKDYTVCHISKRKKGFTVIELLVVLAIMSLISSLAMANLRAAKEMANIAKARIDLNLLRTAILQLEGDTGLHPNHLELMPCKQKKKEVYLDSCESGIQCTDGGFPGWDGPYMLVPLDPWGTYYYFNPDYKCKEQIGCEGVPKNAWTRAIVSFGPNKTEGDEDDILLVLCIER